MAKIKIGILTITDTFESSPILGFFKQLETKYKARVILIDPKDIKFVFSGTEGKINEEEKKPDFIYYKGKELKLDVILPRISSGISMNQFLMAINVMDYLRNYTDIPIINFTKGMLIANDKFWQGEYIASHGYRVPKTVFVSDKDNVNSAIGEFNKYPLIIKNQYGSEGIGVSIVESERSARSVISSMLANNNGVIVQKYLPVKGGQDLRVYVVGSKAVKGIIRTAAKNDFRANVYRGGSKRSFKPDKIISRMAIDIANLVGLEIAAVDFMYHDGKYYFIEINKSPGTKNDIKTAEKIMEYVLDRCKKKLKKPKKFVKKFKIKDLNDAKRVFDSLDINLFTIGKKAFRHVIPSFLMKDYGILSFKTTNDIGIINKYARVRSLQDRDLEYINYTYALTSADNIEYGYVENYLRRFSDAHLLIYEDIPQVRKIIENSNVSAVFANRASIKEKYENKLYFRKFLDKIGVLRIPYENFKIDVFNQKLYKDFLEEFGKWFVIQLPETSSGGGRNTFIIKKEDDFKRVSKVIKSRNYRGEEIGSVDVVDYVTGVSASLNCCVTKYGVFVGQLGKQLIDIPEVRNRKSLYRGKYCGNEWGDKIFSLDTERKAIEIARKIGQEMRKRSNYRGLVGIDFICNEKKGLVVPIECNPRPTGGLVSEALMEYEKGIIPMEAFQILESLKVNYAIDFKKIYKKYVNFRKTGSNLYLYNRRNKPVKMYSDIKAGIYSYTSNGNIKFIKSSIRVGDFTSKKQFIIAESITSDEAIVVLEDDTSQILRLIFPTQITKGDKQQLKDDIKNVVKNIYKKIGI